jgi:hypothetical protein
MLNIDLRAAQAAAQNKTMAFQAGPYMNLKEKAN